MEVRLMPTYTYQCASCGAKKEVTRSYYLGDIIEPVCENCAAEMARVFEASAVHYKGRGWYVKDKFDPENLG